MAKDKITIPSSKVAISLAAGSTEPAMKAAEAKSSKVFNVPLASIKAIPGFNVRVDSPDYRAHRDMIAQSIKVNGYDATKPLAGYVAKEGDENVIYLTDGHTRLDAANTLGDDAPATLPVIVRSPAPSLTDLTVALHTSNTGRPLSPFELGVVVKRLLKEDGADKASIAERLAVTTRYLDDVLLLVNSPKEIRTAVLEGKVSSTLAIQELRKAGDTVLNAVTRIQAAVDKATASGKAKATAKDVEAADEDSPKMKTIKATVSVADGTDMKEIVKAVAAKVREAIPVSLDGDGDDAVKLASVDGTITISIAIPAPATEKKAKPAKAAAEKKPAAKKTAAAKKSETPLADTAAKAKKSAAKADAKAEATSEKKPAAKKGGKKPAAETPPADDADENITADDSDDDIGIPGATAAEHDRTDTDLDLPAPPAVKNGEGVDDEESDI